MLGLEDEYEHGSEYEGEAMVQIEDTQVAGSPFSRSFSLPPSSSSSSSLSGLLPFHLATRVLGVST